VKVSTDIGLKPNGIFATKVSMEDIKGRTVRGGFMAICSQPVIFLLRTGALILLARLLVPAEFGLVGMVTAVTGVIGLFKDAGLSMVTVQRSDITDEQVSALFWINMAVGILLGSIAIAIAPFLVSFYREPRLFWVTVALGVGFIFSAAATQHQALLSRQMRYAALVVIDVLSLLVSVIIGIAMAALGFGYWALVGMQVALPAANAACVWWAMPWTPSMPRRSAGIRSMLHFGGTVTLNSLVVYAAYNVDKILLGRYWGAEALGIYGRSYQLYNLPLGSLNSAINSVAFPALSRLQGDDARFKNYFLRGYSLVVSVTVPFVVGCALFADEIILVLLGPKWMEAAAVLRLLAPTGLALALINPLGPLLMAKGLVGRSLKMALVIAPVVIVGYIAGLQYGPTGVAVGFSVGMLALIIPMIMWAKQDTSITSKEILRAISRPFISGMMAAMLTIGTLFFLGQVDSPPIRMLIGGGVLAASYLWMLLYVMGQKEVFLSLLAELKGSVMASGL
jgi:O-antigen/teichoic acid export membrane protein